MYVRQLHAWGHHYQLQMHRTQQMTHLCSYTCAIIMQPSYILYVLEFSQLHSTLPQNQWIKLSFLSVLCTLYWVTCTSHNIQYSIIWSVEKQNPLMTLRGRTYAKKLHFLRKKRAGYANLKMPCVNAKNSDLTHQNAFSLFVFCTHQRRFVEHLPWV